MWKKTAVTTIYILLFVCSISCSKRLCCQLGEECWPTEDELQELYQLLDPTTERTLYWEGDGTPRVCAVPIGSPGEQPLYGDGQNLAPLYTQQGDCIENQTFCRISVKNAPYDDWRSSIVVWPISEEQIQYCLNFAVAHNLCVCVAGTGHDFLNRHSCQSNGMFIRTALLKQINFDMEKNTVQLGAGLTFSEIQQSASSNSLYVSSGWATTVGIIGWSLGGGHGPFAPSSGMGVDNIVAANIVLANGTLVEINSTSRSDLLFALRGGGGSNWGVLSSITINTYQNPAGGFTLAQVMWGGYLCNEGLDRLNSLIDSQLEWSLTLDNKWGGLTFITPNFTASPCPSWTLYSKYIYLGPSTDQSFIEKWNEKVSEAKLIIFQSATTFTTWWDVLVGQGLEPIVPFGYMSPTDNFVGGVPSVCVSRDQVNDGSLGSLLKTRVAQNDWGRQELYQDITGNIGSPQGENVAINPAMRRAMYHVVFGTANQTISEEYYKLGSSSYFGESAYDLPDWRSRYWGSNYDQLLETKNKYDPFGIFWCRHCVGADV